MKKIFITLLGIAAIAAVSCQPKEQAAILPGNEVLVSLTADQPDTRTYIEAEKDGWQPYWSPKDSINVTLANDFSKEYRFRSSAETGSVTTKFTGKIEAYEGELTLYAYRPRKSNRKEEIFKFMVGPEQHVPSLSTFDPAYDLLVSQGAQVTVEGHQVVSADKLQFQRMLAVVRIVVEDRTQDKLLTGKKIKSVTLSSSSEVLGGELRVNIPNRSIDSWDNTKYNYVTASYDGNDWTADGKSGVFVLVAPVTFPSGSTLTLNVTTDDANMLISNDVALGQDVSLETGSVKTLKFGISEGSITDASQIGQTYTWDFSTSEWQNAFAKLGSSGTDINNINVTVAGLSYVASKGRYRANCVQMTNAGSTSDHYLKFHANRDGLLKVIASHTGESPTEEQAKRSVCVYSGGSEGSVVAGVSSKTPKECKFNVKAGDVYVYCGVGPLRIYKLEFTEGGNTSGGEEPGGEEPQTPGEIAELDCPNPPSVGTVAANKLYGYAQAAGVTGGDAADATHVLHFDNGKALQTWLLARTKSEKAGDHSPVTIWLSGTFGPEDGRDFSAAHPWFDVKDVSNLSFYGTDGFVMDRIGIFCVRASNIIIRNINFQQPKANNGADAVSMQECNGVWVDHCSFTSLNQTKDYEDGSTDITHASKNVTVSWCHYIKTQKSCLVGHSNSASADAAITATFHHNWFDGSSSRHPRVRFGTAHVYNNLYDGCTTYGAGSAYGAKVLVEYNYFDGVQLPTDICTYPAKESGESNLQGSVAGYLYPTQNVYVNRPAKALDPYPLSNVKYTKYNGSTITPLGYNDFKPAYSYTVTAAEDVPAFVKAGAGYGKLGWTSAPVAVNNGGISDYNGTDDDPTNPDTGDEDDPAQPAAGLSDGWSWVNNSAATATYAVTDGKLSIASSGKWESGAQGFGSAYREVSGNFTATVKLDSFSPAKGSNQGIAGLIVFTSSPSATETSLLYAVSGKGDKYYRRYRAANSKDGKSSCSEMSAPETSGTGVVFRIVREGDKLKCSYSLDGGTTFGGVSSLDFPDTPDKVYVGVAANSADNKTQGTAVFSNFTINDTAIAF